MTPKEEHSSSVSTGDTMDPSTTPALAPGAPGAEAPDPELRKSDVTEGVVCVAHSAALDEQQNSVGEVIKESSKKRRSPTPTMTRATRGTSMTKQEFDAGVAGRCPRETILVDEADELAAEQPAFKKPRPPPSTGPSRRSKSKFDDPNEMLTNANSPLGRVKTNLRDLLCHPQAWDVLSPSEQAQVLACFPPSPSSSSVSPDTAMTGSSSVLPAIAGSSDILEAGTPAARPDVSALRSNDDFRHDVAQYQQHLRQGRHDPEWIVQAQAAHERRAAGFYDDFTDGVFEEDWAVGPPVLSQAQQQPDGKGVVKVIGPDESTIVVARSVTNADPVAGEAMDWDVKEETQTKKKEDGNGEETDETAMAVDVDHKHEDVAKQMPKDNSGEQKHGATVAIDNDQNLDDGSATPRNERGAIANGVAMDVDESHNHEQVQKPTATQKQESDDNQTYGDSITVATGHGRESAAHQTRQESEDGDEPTGWAMAIDADHGPTDAEGRSRIMETKKENGGHTNGAAAAVDTYGHDNAGEQIRELKGDGEKKASRPGDGSA
ncbi:Asx homology domain-containing protein [Xylariaceae sp. FL0804]|nr:Asx homology domain-containing protein [Xylariaceae sp. FL0804]